jgi:hypothetical protein
VGFETRFLSDAVIAPVWVLVNLLLVLAAVRLSRRLFPGEPISATITHVVVCWCGCVVGAALALGAFGVLSGPGLLLTVLGLAISGLILPSRLPITSRVIPGSTRDTDGPQWVEWCWLAVWGLTFAAWAVHIVCDGLRQFPSDWDSLMYHIPLVDHWLQAGSLYAPDAALWSNPGNGELIGLWMVGSFSGDFLIALTNLPVAVLLGFGTVEAARAFGVGRMLRHAAGLLVVANGVVLRQMTDAENDVAVAGFFVGAVGYGVRYARDPRPTDLALGAVCLGLLAGTKFYAVGYAAALWVIMVHLVAAARGRRHAAALATGWAVGAATLGGYWYVRNAWVTGSPLYPKGLDPTSDPILQVQPHFYTSSFLGDGRLELLPLALHAVLRTAGLVHLAVLLCLPLVLGWLTVSGVRRFRPNSQVDGVARLALVALLLASCLLLGISPFTVENEPGTLNVLRDGYLPVRFGLSLLLLAVIAFALSVDDLSRGWGTRAAHGTAVSGSPNPGGRTRRFVSYALSTVFAAGVVLQQAAVLARDALAGSVDRALVALGVWGAGIGFCCLGVLRPRTLRVTGLVLGAVLLTAAAWAGGRLAASWHSGFTRNYNQLLETTAVGELARRPAGERVCVLDYRYYPFFGSHRQFRVCQPYHIPSPARLADYIRSHGVELVVVVNRDFFTYGRFPHARAWLEDHPEDFELIRKDNWFSVFSVKPERGRRDHPGGR